MSKRPISDHLMRKAMTDPDNCERCDGCGKIADSDRGESWLHWMNLPPGSDLAVRMGIVKPIDCPDCSGTGKRVPS